MLQDETLTYFAGYTEEEIDPVAQLMVDYLARPVVHEAFFKKYASKKFMKGMLIKFVVSRALTDRLSFNCRPPVGKEECPCLGSRRSRPQPRSDFMMTMIAALSCHRIEHRPGICLMRSFYGVEWHRELGCYCLFSYGVGCSHVPGLHRGRQPRS